MLVSGACQTFCQGYKRLLRKSRENTPIFQVSKVPKVSQQRSCARSSSPCLSPACSPPRCLPNSEKRVCRLLLLLLSPPFFLFLLLSPLLIASSLACLQSHTLIFVFVSSDRRTNVFLIPAEKRKRARGAAKRRTQNDHSQSHSHSQKRFFPARLLLFISIPFKMKSKFRLQLVVSTKRRNSHLI